MSYPRMIAKKWKIGELAMLQPGPTLAMIVGAQKVVMPGEEWQFLTLLLSTGTVEERQLPISGIATMTQRTWITKA